MIALGRLTMNAKGKFYEEEIFLAPDETQVKMAVDTENKWKCRWKKIQFPHEKISQFLDFSKYKFIRFPLT